MERGDMLGGRYRLVRPLGQGGMSIVWLGRDEVLERDVAVKLLATDVTADSDVRDRVRTEALAAGQLSHPNIVGVHDYGESADGDSYVVMELVAGQTLSSLLANGPLPWRDAVRVCARIASALAATHARGIAHRDVTPGNVMVTGSGVKLVDFGISALVGEVDRASDDTVIGTPAYLAPERLERTVVNPAADIYALGLVLYRTLAGRLPWDAGTVTQMIRAHYYVDPAPLPVVTGLPPEVTRLCHQCLAKRPEDRPDAATIARTLADAAGLEQTAALPTMSVTALPPRRPAVAIGVVAVLIAVAIGVWPALAITPAGASAQRRAAADGSSTVGAGPVGCQVRYELRPSSAGRFNTAVTLQNTGAVDVTDWRLEFTLPGHQRVVGVSSPAIDWQQSGQTVVLTGPALATGASLRARLHGESVGVNAFPMQFRLNDTACQPMLLAASQTPVSTGDVGAAGDGRGRKGKGKSDDGGQG